ncbi:hypothetical protein F2P79_012718 [Pimephales promelas]|nr:hypothetical protein F2P79_012718 [Pimephales promelas]
MISSYCTLAPPTILLPHSSAHVDLVAAPEFITRPSSSSSSDFSRGFGYQNDTCRMTCTLSRP